jgi:tetratricopeptide (TPR) repeat protein
MNRTLRYKLIYAMALVAAVAIGALLVMLIPHPGVLLLLAAAILVPGRIGALVLKDLFRSRQLASASRFGEAAQAAERFLGTVRRQPWRRPFILCFFGIYTWNVEAMALNNLGVAQMHLGELDSAESNLRTALDRDPEYAIPYFNLAAIAYARGHTNEGDALLSVARDKGYTGGSIDAIVSRVSDAYARIQAEA